MAATLDEVADGRVVLGLGTGWHEPEYAAFGYPFDHRAGRFEEFLSVAVPLVRGERVTFHGRWHDTNPAFGRRWRRGDWRRHFQRINWRLAQAIS